MLMVPMGYGQVSCSVLVPVLASSSGHWAGACECAGMCSPRISGLDLPLGHPLGLPDEEQGLRVELGGSPMCDPPKVWWDSHSIPGQGGSLEMTAF
jgi:hypothetical protein